MLIPHMNPNCFSSGWSLTVFPERGSPCALGTPSLTSESKCCGRGHPCTAKVAHAECMKMCTGGERIRSLMGYYCQATQPETVTVIMCFYYLTSDLAIPCPISTISPTSMTICLLPMLILEPWLLAYSHQYLTLLQIRITRTWGERCPL